MGDSVVEGDAEEDAINTYRVEKDIVGVCDPELHAEMERVTVEQAVVLLEPLVLADAVAHGLGEFERVDVFEYPVNVTETVVELEWEAVVEWELVREGTADKEKVEETDTVDDPGFVAVTVGTGDLVGDIEVDAV